MSTTTSAQPAQLTRNERLDRLPFNKAHRKLLVASGIGWAFDAMDVGLVSFVVAAIAADPHFNLTPTEKSWVLSIGFVGMASYLVFMVSSIVAMAKKIKEQPIVAAVMMAVLAYAIQAVVNINLPIAMPIILQLLAMGVGRKKTADKAEEKAE